MFGGATIGQYVPVESLLHELDPRTKLLMTISGMVAVLVADTGWGLGLVTASMLVLVRWSRIPWRLYLRGMKPLLVFMLLNLVLQLFMVKGSPIFSWNVISISREGLLLGTTMAARLFFLFLLAQLLTFTTSPVALIDGLERLMSPLRKVGIPAYEMAMVMSIALRFIPVFYEETEKMVKAQTARGADFETGSFFTRIANLTSILVPLFIKALKRADELALAMEVRCYAGGEGRTRLRVIRMHSRDYWFLMGSLLVVVVVVLVGVNR